VTNSRSLESTALLLSGVVFVVGAVVALLVFWGAPLPISGPGSVGQFTALSCAVVAIVVFVLARILMASNARTQTGSNGRSDRGTLHWFDIAALAVAHAIIALLGWLALADLLSRSFTDAMVYFLPAAILAGVAMAVSAYVVFLSAVGLTPMRVSLILAVFLVVGTLASTLSAADPHWWQKNLSTLGISDDVSALAFNVTLIVAGVLVTIVAHYATATITATTASEKRGRSIVRVGLMLMGILLACVGLLPVDEHLGLHNTSATGMAVIFVGLVIGLRWFVPGISRVFVILGYVDVAVIVVVVAFFIVGYYNLTAVEIVAFLLIFSWIILFLRNSGASPSATASAAGRPDSVAGTIQATTGTIPPQEILR
jgi:Protein of unknown function (DUF998)